MSLDQTELFVSPLPVRGLSLVEDLVTPDEEAELSEKIDAVGLTPFKFQRWEGKRLTASFGHGYDFERGRTVDAPPLRDWLLPLRARAAGFAGVCPDRLVQALVIRYDPGAGIGWHRDRPQFGTVVGVSLGGEVTLRLRRRIVGGFERRAISLPPRSAYVLDGDARQLWEHSIVPVEAARRSVTFRTLR